MKTIQLVLTASLMVPFYAAAQTAEPAPTTEASKEGFKSLVDGAKTDRADLRAKEIAAADAIKADTTLTDAQRAEKLAASRKDYKAQSKALQRKYVADKKAMRAEIKKNRAEARTAPENAKSGSAHGGGSDKGRSGAQTPGNAGAAHGNSNSGHGKH